MHTEPPVNDFDGWDNPPVPPPTRRVTRRRGTRGSSGGVHVGTILTQV
jgi:hypothetical protein